MPYRRSLAPRTRHVHSVTVEDDVWAWLVEHCIKHNQNPGEVIESSLKKHLDPKVKPAEL